MAGIDLDAGAHAGAQLRGAGHRRIAMRTGMRCTTLTQLPVAFWGGSTENSAPVAWLMLATVPRQSRSG